MTEKVTATVYPYPFNGKCYSLEELENDVRLTLTAALQHLGCVLNASLRPVLKEGDDYNETLDAMVLMGALLKRMYDRESMDEYEARVAQGQK